MTLSRYFYISFRVPFGAKSTGAGALCGAPVPLFVCGGGSFSITLGLNGVMMYVRQIDAHTNRKDQTMTTELTKETCELVDETTSWILQMINDYEDNYRPDRFVFGETVHWVHYYNDTRTRHLYVRRPGRVADLFYATNEHGPDHLLHVYYELMNEPDEVWICDTDVVHFDLQLGNTFHGTENLQDFPTDFDQLAGGREPGDELWAYIQITMTDYAS